MEQLVLQQWVLDSIKKDPALYAQIASKLGISCYTMPKLIRDNDPRLTQASVLKTLKEHLQILEISELLTDMQAA